MSLLHGVIIAGGRGERLGGVRKADLRIGGRRLVDRVAAALGPVAPPLMIAVGPDDDGRGRRDGAAAVTDLPAPVGGPLAGLAAAVAALQERGIGEGLLVSAAVDTPFLPDNFGVVMLDALGDASAAFAGWGADFYPPNAIWRIEALANLPGQITAGTAPGSLKGLQARLGARRVDWSGRAAANPFLNVNMLADLLMLGRHE
ncbi:molybdenum cofactor guanylyltransferase [Devosia ginsengisoli]|uniref:molybdenum cofactor guanylyltransferase n=1 Tax=Devosia ginsengisoli TaxID=400770 RepID=UPI0026EE97C3|nr:NTP transferase domain-containing protein [Devosia ginsengisoli]MCR6672845.1 NTP transferase domain-containing protein [Devosia ginsengisoli]